jgi:hypothetical protein
MRSKLRTESARVAPEKRLHPGPPADLLDVGMPRGRRQVKKTKLSESIDRALQPITPEILALFQKALDGRTELRNRVNSMSAKPRLSVREQLELAWRRNELAFREPSLPEGTPLTTETLWKYWIDHPKAAEHRALSDEIMSYLKSADELNLDKEDTKLQMLDLIATDPVAHLALYPVVVEIGKKKRGRPIARGPVTVRGLQMRVDRNLSWLRIAREVCDCGKKVHDQYCSEALRQSVIALQRLLKRLGANARTA